jgi:hypothetical protein
MKKILIFTFAIFIFQSQAQNCTCDTIKIGVPINPNPKFKYDFFVDSLIFMQRDYKNYCQSFCYTQKDIPQVIIDSKKKELIRMWNEINNYIISDMSSDDAIRILTNQKKKQDLGIISQSDYDKIRISLQKYIK